MPDVEAYPDEGWHVVRGRSYAGGGFTGGNKADLIIEAFPDCGPADQPSFLAAHIDLDTVTTVKLIAGRLWDTEYSENGVVMEATEFVVDSLVHDPTRQTIAGTIRGVVRYEEPAPPAGVPFVRATYVFEREIEFTFSLPYGDDV
ncbi:MAG: hypothetical protein RIT81_05475 [Deltaproteobacteria bacterium]